MMKFDSVDTILGKIRADAESYNIRHTKHTRSSQRGHGNSQEEIDISML